MLLDPVSACVLFLVVPVLIGIVNLTCLKTSMPKNVGSKLLLRISKYVIDYAWSIFLVNFVIAALLCYNQWSYASAHLAFGSDINYYLRVDLDEYDYVNSINKATDSSSFNNIYSPSFYISSRYITLSQSGGGRILSSSESISLIYHTNSWADVINSADYLNICSIERSIRQSVTCIDYSEMTSLIPQSVDPDTCEYRVGKSDKTHNF